MLSDESATPPDTRYYLCYVDEPWAYFTTQSQFEQWGDDWGDGHYKINAGPPYTPTWQDRADGKNWHIKRVAFDGPLVTPGEDSQSSVFSVRNINHHLMAPWLRTLYAEGQRQTEIWAWTPLPTFKEKVASVGGHVWECPEDTEHAHEKKPFKMPAGSTVQLVMQTKKEAVFPVTITFTEDGVLTATDYFNTVVAEERFNFNGQAASPGPPILGYDT